MPPRDPPGCLSPEVRASAPLGSQLLILPSLIKAFIRRALLTAAVPYFLFSCFWAALPGRLQTMTMTPACSQLRATRGEWESSIRWGHCEENGEVVL